MTGNKTKTFTVGHAFVLIVLSWQQTHHVHAHMHAKTTLSDSTIVDYSSSTTTTPVNKVHRFIQPFLFEPSGVF